MKTILLALLLLYAISATPQCMDVDIMLLADFSGSVSGYEQTVVDALETFINAFDLDEQGVGIGVAIFNGASALVSPIAWDPLQLLLQTSQLRAVDASGTTDMAAGLQLASHELLAGGRSGYRKLIIVISDGDVNDPATALAIAQQLPILGIGICAVLIRNNVSKPLFMTQISGGCYAETDYENLAAELKNLDICL